MPERRKLFRKFLRKGCWKILLTLKKLLLKSGKLWKVISDIMYLILYLIIIVKSYKNIEIDNKSFVPII
jgi:hypothetical protein